MDPQVLFDKLSGFQDAEEIANYFRQEGIQGAQVSSARCPLANYYASHGFTCPIVGPDNSHIGMKHLKLSTFENTEAMTEFVYKFDGGNYPDLIERN